MRVFLEQNVDVAIFEVGLGGRLDATNCIRCPVVCGISALGFDHMDVLGHTLPVRSIQCNMQHRCQFSCVRLELCRACWNVTNAHGTANLTQV